MTNKHRCCLRPTSTGSAWLILGSGRGLRPDWFITSLHQWVCISWLTGHGTFTQRLAPVNRGHTETHAMDVILTLSAPVCRSSKNIFLPRYSYYSTESDKAFWKQALKSSFAQPTDVLEIHSIFRFSHRIYISAATNCMPAGVRME